MHKLRRSSSLSTAQVLPGAPSIEMAPWPEDVCPISTRVQALGSNSESKEPDLQISKMGASYLYKMDTLKRKNKQKKTQATDQKIKGGKGFFTENIKADEKSEEKVKNLKEKNFKMSR